MSVPFLIPWYFLCCVSSCTHIGGFQTSGLLDIMGVLDVGDIPVPLITCSEIFFDFLFILSSGGSREGGSFVIV